MKIYVKPATVNVGRGDEPVSLTYKVRGQRKRLPPEGAVVDKTPFWVRRRNEGAVTFEPIPKKKVAKSAKES